jgi:hypothetical protein
MTSYMIPLLVLSALALAYAQSAQDDWCYAVGRVDNGKISCTGTAKNGMMESKTLCTFICNEKYRRTGPEKIYCFAAEWLNHDAFVQSGYKVKQVHEETLCDVDPDAVFEDGSSQRAFSLVASQRPAVRERCAIQRCHLSFNGQTKIGCLAQNCCWNEKTNKCHAKVCTGQLREQVGISRTTCLNSRGAGDPVCQYNADEGECYIAGKIITTVNENTMPSATHTWSANLLNGRATFDTKYETTRRNLALGRKLPKTNIVSVDEKLTKPKRTPWGRVGSCTFGGQANVDTQGKEVVIITLEYNDWDLAHTFALANTDTEDRKEMLATMFTDFRSIAMKFPIVNQQRTARKPHPFISGIKSIKFIMTRATSTLDYTMELRRSKMTGSIVIPNLFNSEETFRIFMNQGIKWSRGFGLCSVNINAS